MPFKFISSKAKSLSFVLRQGLAMNLSWLGAMTLLFQIPEGSKYQCLYQYQYQTLRLV